MKRNNMGNFLDLFLSTENYKMAKRTTNLHKVKNQTSFLEQYLRGTGSTISVAQAQANYGISKLTARISELRASGLQVKTLKNTAGNTAYKISARDVNGSRAMMFN